MELSVYIARQPIFDVEGNIFAYELLYRDTQENHVNVQNNMHATARVLVNALNYIGLQTLTEGKIAFIKVDDKAIMDDIIFSISPHHFVLEILEDTLISAALVKRIEFLTSRGYRFALNHYASKNNFLLTYHLLLGVIEFVKVDIVNSDDYEKVITKLRAHEIKIITEKLENREDYNKAISLNFQYFQGYYFAQPDIFTKERIDPQSSQLLEIIYLLKKDASFDKLLEVFNASPYLTLNLLKFIHIHEHIEKDKIASIEQALVIIGRERLLHWLELMVYANDEGDEDEDNFSKQLSKQAHHRAILMESLAKRTNMAISMQHAAYMTGLLSMSEVIFQSGFNELLDQIHVEQHVNDALHTKSGELGELLQLVIAIEHDNLRQVTSILGQIGMTQKELNECMMVSYQKAAQH